ncbi:MAG TPA: BMP family protein [Conexibacter sp.]|jgi:basic membrane protein A|nr:BMP family protein [Conexibacter sp.]
MVTRNVRWLALAALCTAGLVGAGCGSSGSSSSSGSKSGAGSKNADAKVAIVLTRSEDSAFGQPAVDAAKDIRAQLGNEVTVQGDVSLANVQQTIEGYAARGYGLVLIDGAEMQQQAALVAPRYPKVKFVVVNGNTQAAPNLSSATFAWEQSGFLAGIAAGIATHTNKVGMVSTIEIPPIQGLYYGFQQGVKQVNPKASTTNSYMGTNVPDTGLTANLTSAQASQGRDVVFTVATSADGGVFRAAGEKNVKVIGYGSDETSHGPKVILTSALVDYRGTILQMAKLFDQGKLEPKVYSYGFEDHVFSLAPIANVPPAVADRIKRMADRAAAGEFTIKPLES